MIGRMSALMLALLLGSASVIRSGAEQEVKPEGGVCSDTEGTGDVFTLSVSRKLNHSSGEWLRTFSARKVHPGKSAGGILELEASQGSVECDGKGIMHVRVVVKEVPGNGSGVSGADTGDRLRFHPRHGKNAIISDNGRSVQKIDINDPLNAVVFTHRPLRNDELFEVRLDKRTVKQNHCFALGVMTHSPDTVQILPSMHTLKNGTWVYHNDAIYSAGTKLSGYVRDLNKIQEGERLGVVRRENGSIHFTINGLELGPAVSNIPQPVHGIFEVWYDAVKGTIVS
ncbi:neuralized-like protein 4 [Hetaerina americana]|uniref:neuralized-like protein 4 n=1 Tax=Hetaerina americana TaxID=62018 RepID=UPI003A7F27DD